MLVQLVVMTAVIYFEAENVRDLPTIVCQIIINY